MEYTVATFCDAYRYGASVRRTRLGRWKLIVHHDGKTIYSREYKSWAGARRAMNRFSDCWHEIKKS